MVQYDKILLNALIDSYERSLLFTGENKVNRRISFSFTQKTLPDYFEESSLAYEEIHACVQELEQREFISVEWKSGKAGHIITKVFLRDDKLQEIYKYLHRTSRYQLQEQAKMLLKQAEREYETPVCAKLISYLRERLEANKSVREYMDLSDLDGMKRILRTIYLIEKNGQPCYIREFSIRHFSDSKVFEGMSGSVTKIMHNFADSFKGMELSDILAEYNIYHTPNYVYFKGNVVLKVGGNLLPIGPMRQGIGVSGEDLPKICLQDVHRIQKVITIENLTTFFRWQEENSLILYLGGYHNSVRRSLLKMIYEQLPNVGYYHFGDIDVGGFEIYEDLCAKTGIPFRLYRMDIDTLEKYTEFGRKLTENDKKRIKKILEKDQAPYGQVLQYMLSKDMKLEQECVDTI